MRTPQLISAALIRLGAQAMLEGKAYEHERVLTDDLEPFNIEDVNRPIHVL